jgi:hypothetical protein
MNRHATTRIILTRTAYRAACLTIFFGLAVGSGCSPKNKAGVTGRVTLGGKPIENVRVIFVPERGPGAAGNTSADGGYVLHAGPRDKNWVVTGRCDVFFIDLTDPPSPSRFPERYSSAKSSGLTAELKVGPNECNFDLEQK